MLSRQYQSVDVTKVGPYSQVLVPSPLAQSARLERTTTPHKAAAKQYRMAKFARPRATDITGGCRYLVPRGIHHHSCLSAPRSFLCHHHCACVPRRVQSKVQALQDQLSDALGDLSMARRREEALKAEVAVAGAKLEDRRAELAKAQVRAPHREGETQRESKRTRAERANPAKFDRVGTTGPHVLIT